MEFDSRQVLREIQTAIADLESDVHRVRQFSASPQPVAADAEKLKQSVIVLKSETQLELGGPVKGSSKLVLCVDSPAMSDAADLAAALNNPNIQNNLRDGLPYPYTEKDAGDYIDAMLHADKNATFAFAITVDDKAIGSIGVFRKDNIHSRTAEMGYYISELFWGQGLGTSAVKQTWNCPDS